MCHVAGWLVGNRCRWPMTPLRRLRRSRPRPLTPNRRRHRRLLTSPRPLSQLLLPLRRLHQLLQHR